MTNPPDDQQLLQAAQRGDVAAFTVLVKRHQNSVRAFLAVRLATPMDAEDLAQEVFITAFRKLKEFDLAQPFAPWLRGMALNLWRNHQRKFRALPIGGHAELQLLLDERLAQQQAIETEGDDLQVLRDCLEQMAGPARDLLQARYADGMSVRELCQSTGRNHSAITMQLHRLRSLLAACMAGKGRVSA